MSQVLCCTLMQAENFSGVRKTSHIKNAVMKTDDFFTFT